MAGSPSRLQAREFTIGVLALQGAFREHVRMLEGLGVLAREVRLPGELKGLQGLIIPGGESTTMVNLMTSYGFWEELLSFAKGGGAIWGTCAGAILLAREVQGGSPSLGAQRSLGLIDLTVQRNAFGRQVDSFHVPLEIHGLDGPFPAVFIRAPLFDLPGPEVEILARYQQSIVLARQGRILVSSFHPELSDDSRLHEYFLALAKQGTVTEA